MTITTDDIDLILQARINGLKEILNATDEDDLGAFGAYVIELAPGCYYREGVRGPRGVHWASRYRTHLSAALKCSVGHGTGIKGTVLHYRAALNLEISRLEEALAKETA